jgi:hypothetical protein
MVEDHRWPGNVRELRNVVQRLVVVLGRTLALGALLGVQPLAAVAQEIDEPAASDEAGVELEDPPLRGHAPDSADSADLDAPDWSLQLAAEAGFGMREVDLPRDGVTYRIRTGAHPALGVAFQLDYRAAQRLRVGLCARYQSSIGLVLDEQLTGGTLHARKTRSHHFEVGIAPSLHWDAGWAILGMLGYSIVELDPENHLVTPSYHLGGPHARVAVRIPIGSEGVRLTLGPEGQLTLQTGDELTARGVSARGLGAGASASLDIRLGERWWIAASYRELRFWSSTDQGRSFTDGVRLVTAQLGGHL